MVLTALVVVLGPALGVIPITLLQLVIGLLLLLFGMNWLRKAVLRAAGIIPLHDEGEIFRSATATLRPHERQAIRWDTIAIVTTFKAVVLEGLEIVFIVLAVGTAAHMMVPASLPAAAAGLVVAVAGVALRRPLARVPENHAEARGRSPDRKLRDVLGGRGARRPLAWCGYLDPRAGRRLPGRLTAHYSDRATNERGTVPFGPWASACVNGRPVMIMLA